ncbi:SH3 domain-containing protein [Mesorhizobium sp. LSJC269B00]|uniref:SH3 domain-containing protein n=2 Tax=Mesorhizobium TaxID=68287 RepID=UPI0032AEDA19
MANEHADQRGFKGRDVLVAAGSGDEPKERMMNFHINTAAALAVVASTVLAFTGQSHATAFAAWQVAGVPFGDTLNVRKYPSGTSQKQAAYPNGTILQMTGKCTSGLNLLEIAGQPHWKQKQAIRYQWCQVWHDPAQNGAFVSGWVYGKYLTPY